MKLATLGQIRKASDCVSIGHAYRGVMDLLKRTLGAKSFSALRGEAFDYFLSKGVSRLSYHHYPPIGAPDSATALTIAAVGFPERWVKTYVENKYFDNDPIIRVAIASTRPFWWHEIEQLTALSPREEFYMKKMQDFDLGVGLAVPVFGPHGRNGYFGVGFGSSQPNTTSEEISGIQWSCQLIHLRFVELLRVSFPVEVQHSIREREVLTLIASGKTNTQIAEELDVTPKTVSTYVARSFDKLDAHDRMTAALRAKSTGLLD